MTQFARSPVLDTCKPPRMVRSTCALNDISMTQEHVIRTTTHPRIMANESEDEKIDDPGSVVIVSFPALIKSGSC